MIKGVLAPPPAPERDRASAADVTMLPR